MLVNINFLAELLEKAATIKTFEYWPLVDKLKKQTSIAKANKV